MQASGVGLGDVIKGSLSAEVGPVLIGVVSHAGSPRPGSPGCQGSIAHAGQDSSALHTEPSLHEVRSSLAASPSVLM